MRSTEMVVSTVWWQFFEDKVRECCDDLGMLFYQLELPYPFVR